MISREEHLKQVNRFHDLLEKVDKAIEQSKDGDSNRFGYLKLYFDLTSKAWCLVDDCVEHIKIEVDHYEEEYERERQK